MDASAKLDMIEEFRADHLTAHRFFFEERHPFSSAPFHFELLEDWYSSDMFVVHKAFRGAAKSTKAEEAIALMACLGEFQNGIILKASEPRAKESLAAIKNIFDTNDLLQEYFGDMKGPTWAETKIITANGICIQAIGKGQKLRGTKHNNLRPDLVLCDDLEDDEDVSGPGAHRQLMNWFFGQLLPAMQLPYHRVRVVGTPLAAPDMCLIEKLMADPSYKTRTIPVRHYDEAGELVSVWPELYPIDKINEIEQRYRSAGQYATFAREYLVEATPKEEQVFSPSMFRVMPQVRTWEPTYVAVDPARTTSEESSFTGWAAWTVYGSRIHVWEADGAHISPSEINDKIFQLNETYSPIELGIEKDGLELFLMQPLQTRMLKEGLVLPIRELKAPKDRNKFSFIEGLQPFASSNLITFNEPLPLLTHQLSNFPKGRLDVLNALAYVTVMQSGIPVYDFNLDSVYPDVSYSGGSPVYVVFNSDGARTSATAVQYDNSRLKVLTDYVISASPSACFSDIYRRVTLDVNTFSRNRARIRYIAPPEHFAQRDTVGLRAAAQRARIQLGAGGPQAKGRVHLQDLLRSTSAGEMIVQVNPFASYTLRGLVGGYRRQLTSDTSAHAVAERNVYSVPVEALESFAASLQSFDALEEDNSNVRFATSRDGRSYITSKP